jgi:hypothetical protein
MIKKILSGLFCLFAGLFFLGFDFPYMLIVAGICGVILGIWYLVE